MEFEAMNEMAALFYAPLVLMCLVLIIGGLYAALRDFIKGAEFGILKWSCRRGGRHALWEDCECPEPEIILPPEPEFFASHWGAEPEKNIFPKSKNNA